MHAATLGPAAISPAAAPRRLRIGIDAHAVGQRQTGNERFAANMIRALREICDHQLVLYFTEPAAAAEFATLPDTRTRLLRPRHPLLRIPFGLPLLATHDDVDVLFVQYAGPPVFGRPLVTIVHDAAFELLPQHFRPLERLWMPRAIPFTMRRASRIVTVSDFSRDELVRVFGIEPAKITVAHNGVAPIFRDQSPRPSSEQPPYFVSVGNLQPRKNLQTLLAAYARALELRPQTAERLVIVGQDAYAAGEIRGRAEELCRRGRVVFTGYVSDPQLVGLLQGATAFAYPSVYEGFGLPPVEAMAAGVPSVVSDIPVMREIVGDAALRVSPLDVEGWAQALLRLAEEPALRARLSAEGRQRASAYTWEKSARAVLSALESSARVRA